MKIKKETDSESKKSSVIKTAILKKKTENLKVSKLVVQDKKNFEEAKNHLLMINGSECDLESSFSEDNLRELSLADVMKAINELSSDSDTKRITDCANQMSQESEIFWTSPRAILRAIKYSIVKRDWDNITHLLLLLLHHKGQYVPVVRKLCLFISKYNPIIGKLGLKEEFEMLTEKKTFSNDNKFAVQEKL